MWVVNGPGLVALVVSVILGALVIGYLWVKSNDDDPPVDGDLLMTTKAQLNQLLQRAQAMVRNEGAGCLA
jgi:hypothetical protein